MVHTSIQEGVYSLLQNIGQESILKEYKEFYLRRSLTLYDYRDLQKGILTTKVQNYLEKTLEYYFNKYLKKYICSLTNIDKHFLEVDSVVLWVIITIVALLFILSGVCSILFTQL